MIQFLNNTYKFFEVVPEPIPFFSGDKKVGEIPILNYHSSRLRGKVYKTSNDLDKLIIAFERDTEIGEADLADAKDNLASSISGGSIETPFELKP